ncbi:MAG: rhomboid family intramembrane serine protease, partial [Candidatus Thermoplasmatota archaeon]|nr:rhomboid family intramembrane serine protease [Candidatus Thermoplasmatota archaeon]
MFPLRDENPTELTPWVTTTLIVINVAVWLYVQGGGFDLDALTSSVCRFGTIPAEITGSPAVNGDPEALRCPTGGLTWTTLLTSMFLHGSWLHLIGNLWFLWLFGNNVEDSMGHLRFLAFYLLTGLAADGAHV